MPGRVCAIAATNASRVTAAACRISTSSSGGDEVGIADVGGAVEVEPVGGQLARRRHRAAVGDGERVQLAPAAALAHHLVEVGALLDGVDAEHLLDVGERRLRPVPQRVLGRAFGQEQGHRRVLRVEQRRRLGLDVREEEQEAAVGPVRIRVLRVVARPVAAGEQQDRRVDRVQELRAATLVVLRVRHGSAA
jgi:hypothetical protein